MITFQELYNKLNANKSLCSNKFILYSKDNYSINKSLDFIKQKIYMPELNITIADEADYNVKDIINMCETIPFMSETRLVILKSSFLSESNKDKSNFTKDLSKYLPTLPKSTLLVMYFYQQDKRENISKNDKANKLQKSGAILVSNCKNQSLEMKEIIKDKCKENKIELSNEISDYIVSNAENMDLLINDIDKLKFMKDININNIKKVFSSLSNDDIFDLTNAISIKDGFSTLEIFNSLLDKGEPPIKILSMLTRQFRLLFYCKIALMQGISSDNEAKKLSLHPYVCKLLFENCSKFDLKRLEDNLTKCLDMEIKLKTISSTDVKSDIETLIIQTLM